MAIAVSGASQLHGSTVRLTRDDITLLEVDAFVFYASHDLKLGAGYGTAISVRGGPTIQRELDELGSLETCEAVVTAAGELPADWIIHAVGPRFQEPDIEPKLHRTMAAVLEQAEARGVRRIAFPPMGAGYYGIPPDLCARVMLESLEEHLSRGSGISEVLVSVLDAAQQRAFESALDTLLNGEAS